jgi:hypothetical protein
MRVHEARNAQHLAGLERDLAGRQGRRRVMQRDDARAADLDRAAPPAPYAGILDQA